MRKDAGKLDEIDSLFCLLPVKSKVGRPVWPGFSRDRHVAKRLLKPVAMRSVIVGFDTSGLHPAAVICQQLEGRWCVLDELYGSELGLELFMTGALIPFFTQYYKGCDVVVSCDPANARDSWTGVAPTVRLAEAGLRVALPVTNKVQTRIDAVAALLNKDYGGLMISPNCVNLIEAMEGGYHYVRHKLRGSVDYVYAAEPAKNDFSHIADALQYMALHVIRAEAADGLGKYAAAVSKRNKLKGRLRAA
jgi:hypothetical protein